MSAESELTAFIEKFTPEMQDRIRRARASLARRFPDAVQMVYNNYNFLVIGFGPTARPSEAVFSLAASRAGINLCFLQRGPDLPDPTNVLRGSGKMVRNVRLAEATDLDSPAVDALISAALGLAAIPMSSSDGPELLIKSVSAKQRSRH
jgi:hypothetical protein